MDKRILLWIGLLLVAMLTSCEFLEKELEFSNVTISVYPFLAPASYITKSNNLCIGFIQILHFPSSPP